MPTLEIIFDTMFFEDFYIEGYFPKLDFRVKAKSLLDIELDQ